VIVIRRQVGHGNFGSTSIHPQDVANAELIETVHSRRALRAPLRP
jgi:hypothetical protein